MELKQVGEKTYYIEHKTNIGVYKTGENSVCLIDTGSQGDGEKIDAIISAQGWTIDYIVNTHTHIDHLGGNEYIMKKYRIPAYCTDYDMSFAHYSDLEAAYMNGGYPCKKLRQVFSHPGMIGFRALEENELSGLEWIYLPGHTFGMVGVKTSDDIWFLADSYISREFLKKYRYCYLYDVGGYLETLDRIERLEGNLFIPSHGIAETDIAEIVGMNKKNIVEIADMVEEICRESIAADQIFAKVYEVFGIKASFLQHTLVSSTTRCFISYLQDRGRLSCKLKDNIMMWEKTV